MFFILIFCLFCSQLTVLFTHFSARCKILFWVDTPWKSLCQSISTWYTGHNLNMGEQLYTIHCLLLYANLILLALSLNWLPPWIFFVYFLICHVMTWVKIKRFVLYCKLKMFEIKLKLIVWANFFVFNIAKKVSVWKPIFPGLNKIYMGLNFSWFHGSQGRNRNQA